MKYYYGNDYKEAMAGNPVEIKSAKLLEAYKEIYNVVVPAEEYEEECEEPEKKEYFVAFEIQGNEQLVVKVETDAGEGVALSRAAEVYLNAISTKVDRYLVDKDDVWRYDCPVIDEDGEECDLEKEEED